MTAKRILLTTTLALLSYGSVTHAASTEWVFKGVQMLTNKFYKLQNVYDIYDGDGCTVNRSGLEWLPGKHMYEAGFEEVEKDGDIGHQVQHIIHTKSTGLKNSDGEPVCMASYDIRLSSKVIGIPIEFADSPNSLMGGINTTQYLTADVFTFTDTVSFNKAAEAPVAEAFKILINLDKNVETMLLNTYPEAKQLVRNKK